MASKGRYWIISEVGPPFAAHYVIHLLLLSMTIFLFHVNSVRNLISLKKEMSTEACQYFSSVRFIFRIVVIIMEDPSALNVKKDIMRIPGPDDARSAHAPCLGNLTSRLL